MPLLTADERVGQVLAEKYRIERIIGRGGNGVVYAGTHEWTGRPVAVKLLLPELTTNATVVQRFLREARAAAALKHPNVIDVLDMGRTDDGTVYLVLELLEGEPLSELLHREGPLSPARAASFLLPVMEALAVAHERGIVHRDIKPENIFALQAPFGSAEGPKAKILDFGIAKDFGDARATKTGSAMGTPAYMPREQFENAAEVTFAADVWAMGVVWYEALSGKMPYEWTTVPGLIAAIMTKPPRPLREADPAVPQALCDVIERALRLAPYDRWPSMRAFATALLDAIGGARALAASGSLSTTGVFGAAGARKSADLELARIDTAIEGAGPTLDASSIAANLQAKPTMEAPIARVDEPAERAPAPSPKVSIPAPSMGAERAPLSEPESLSALERPRLEGERTGRARGVIAAGLAVAALCGVGLAARSASRPPSVAGAAMREAPTVRADVRAEPTPVTAPAVSPPTAPAALVATAEPPPTPSAVATTAAPSARPPTPGARAAALQRPSPRVARPVASTPSAAPPAPTPAGGAERPAPAQPSTPRVVNPNF